MTRSTIGGHIFKLEGQTAIDNENNQRYKITNVRLSDPESDTTYCGSGDRIILFDAVYDSGVKMKRDLSYLFDDVLAGDAQSKPKCTAEDYGAYGPHPFKKGGDPPHPNKKH